MFNEITLSTIFFLFNLQKIVYNFCIFLLGKLHEIYIILILTLMTI